MTIWRNFNVKVEIGKGWVTLAVVFLGLVVATIFTGFGHGGKLLGVMFVALVLVPALGIRFFNSSLSREKYNQAKFLAWVLKILHPCDGIPELGFYCQLFEASSLGNYEKLASLRKKLDGIHSQTTWPLVLRIDLVLKNWESFDQWIDENGREQMLKDPQVTIYFIRMYFDRWGIKKGVEFCQWLQSKLPEQFFEIMLYNGMGMVLAAFSGNVDLTEQVVEEMSFTKSEIVAFWIALAKVVNEEPESVKVMERLTTSHNGMVAKGAQYWIDNIGMLKKVELVETQQSFVDDCLKKISDSLNYSLSSNPKMKPVVSLSLISVIAIVFGLELLNGFYEDWTILIPMGALVPDLVMHGQWWRIGAALFLHAGWLHFGFNTLALWLFGPFIEQKMGRVKYLFIYFFAGVGSMAVIVLSAMFGITQGNIPTVGASGAIMGILGATAAILLYGWQNEDSKVAMQKLRSIVMIFVFQVVIDVTTPEISFTGHFFGFILGFCAAFVLCLLSPQRREETVEEEGKENSPQSASIEDC